MICYSMILIVHVISIRLLSIVVLRLCHAHRNTSLHFNYRFRTAGMFITTVVSWSDCLHVGQICKIIGNAAATMYAMTILRLFTSQTIT